MDWNDQTKARLRALWAEGVTTAEIGRRLGCSKSAIVGMAHRMDLPARPSPIRAAGQGPNAAKPRRAHAGAATPPPLSTASAEAAPVRVGYTPAAAPLGGLRPAPGVPPSPLPTPALPQARPPAPSPVAPPRPAFVRPSSECCWPIGEPGTKGFRFCGDPSIPGKSYCPPHRDKAFVATRPRADQYAS